MALVEFGPVYLPHACFSLLVFKLASSGMTRPIFAICLGLMLTVSRKTSDASMDGAQPLLRQRRR